MSSRDDGGRHHIEFFDGKTLVTARLSISGRPGGHAKVVIKGDTAELVDIVIYQRPLRPVLERCVLFWENRQLRGQGLGTSLLNGVRKHLEGRGIRRIIGTMNGNTERLA